MASKAKISPPRKSPLAPPKNNPAKPTRGRPKDEAKHAAIVATARTLFLQYGFDAVSMDTIAEGAAVSKITIYSHFENKLALFRAMVEAECLRSKPPPPPVLRDEDSARQALQEFGFALCTMLSNPELHRLERMLLSHAEEKPEFLQALWDAGPARTRRMLTALLEEAQTLGTISGAHTARLADHLLCMWKGMDFKRQQMGLQGPLSPHKLRRHINECVDVILRAYGNDERKVKMTEKKETSAISLNPEGAGE